MDTDEQETNVRYVKIFRIAIPEGLITTARQQYYWEAYAGNNKCVCWSGEEFDKPSIAIRRALKTFPKAEIRDTTKGES